MNQEASIAGFGALTDDEQMVVVGGDGAQVAQAVGWFVGYALSSMSQALTVDIKLAQGMPIGYAQGIGWF
jgi:hypothetical protein